MPHTIVIGAGVGGLTTAALLLQHGHSVTVLEAQVIPGGSASTFYNRGYRFDAGATLAGGFSAGGPHARLAERLGLQWQVSPADPAWVTHLPEKSITQWNNPQQWQEERQRAFPGTEGFWKLQERLARAAWDISSRPFPWPPAGAADLGTLAQAIRPQTFLAAPYLTRTIASLAPQNASKEFTAFLDAQLIISAQTTSRSANALYGSAALDLPRRGVNHVRGGIGGISQTLVQWIRRQGGKVLYRQPVKKIIVRGGRAVSVETARGLSLDCDYLVANLTPWGLAEILQNALPARLEREIKRRLPTWGAFTLYLGLEGKNLPVGIADHHQVIGNLDLPLDEGNSVFISLSDASDATRAPEGMRAATLSTHTSVMDWWALARGNPQGYADRKTEMIERVIATAERAIPGLRSAVRLCLPGTPLTFQFYTHRPLGMVGGFPQTSLFSARGPWSGIPNLWLVGDSVFPGQSTAATTLGGWRVADAVAAAEKMGRRKR